MNPSFNIDWQRLQGLVRDLEITSKQSPEFNVPARLEMTELIYLIEKDLAEIKNSLMLPLLNTDICSASVEENFKKTQDNIRITKDGKISFDDYFRQNDFQYCLLIFLLIKNNEIRSQNLTLFKIIDQFIDRVKDESFYPGDIELTGSGATRCKTNLRFAFNDLKDLDLVYLYDKYRKNSWTLTFIGFFTAASFCINSIDEENSPLSRRITRFNQSTFYYKINRYILERINWLSNPMNFNYIVQLMKLDSLGLKELEKGPAIFGYYYSYVKNIFESGKNEEDRMKNLGVFLDKLNEEYPLEEYMRELSLRFKAEEFFREVTRGLRVE